MPWQYSARKSLYGIGNARIFQPGRDADVYVYANRLKRTTPKSRHGFSTDPDGAYSKGGAFGNLRMEFAYIEEEDCAAV